MCQYCGKAGPLYMCLDCQSYDSFADETFHYDEFQELLSLNVIRSILVGKRFTSFVHLYTYVNTVHMRKEIEKCGGSSYCLALRRNPVIMKTLCEV